jgi:predicted dienelactone hydrolase
MSPFIVLLMTAVCGWTIRLFLERAFKRKADIVAIAVLAGTLALHLLTEQPRCQFVFLYAAATAQTAVSIFSLLSKKSRYHRRVLRIFATIGICLAIALSLLLEWTFPIVELPKPSGPHAVGTLSFVLTDNSRPELFNAKPNTFRQFRVEAWYPADHVQNPAPLYAGKLSSYCRGMNRETKLPSFLFHYMGYTQTHSQLQASLSTAQPRYPVLIFSHGLGMHPEMYTALIEEVASHGYVVFSINHPHESLFCTLGKGDVRFRRHLEPVNNKQLEAYGRLYNALQATKTTGEQLAILEQMRHAALWDAERSLNVWTQDTRFLLDRLKTLQIDAPAQKRFSGGLDLTNIGIMGHSFGGKAAMQLCIESDQFKAGINIDGFFSTATEKSILKTPFMLMYSTQANSGSIVPPKSRFNDVCYAMAANDIYDVAIKGTTHMDYSDITFLSPVGHRLGFLGRTDAHCLNTISNEYILAFFDRYLKGIDTPVLTEPAYPEVMIRYRLKE